MSEISKKWLIENKYFDKEGIEENLIYSGLTANEFIEILDSYHNYMSDVSDEEIVLKIMDIITDEFGEMITPDNKDYYGRTVSCLEKLSEWLCSRKIKHMEKQANIKMHHGNKWMPALYVTYYGILKDIAREHGYCLAVHGSVNRDFDLVAVPWVENPKTPIQLLKAIKEKIGIDDGKELPFSSCEEKSFGRMAYTIPCGGGGYFDISIIWAKYIDDLVSLSEPAIKTLEFSKNMDIHIDQVNTRLPNKVDVEELIQAIKTQTQIIEALVGSQRVVNLDESISYYKKLVEKHTI